MTIGTMAIERPAMTAGQSDGELLVSSKMPTGSVFSAGRVSMRSASRNSFQMKTAWKIEALASAGPESGRMTREEDLEAVAIVEPRRVLELARKIEEEGVEEDRRERDAVGGVGQHDGEPAVQHAGGAEHLVKRHQHAVHAAPRSRRRREDRSSASSGISERAST